MECSDSYSFDNRNPHGDCGTDMRRSWGNEVKVASTCSKPHNLDAHKVCGDYITWDKDDVEDNIDANAHVNEETCTVCGIQFSLEDYPNNVPVFVPRCLHAICSTCCKDKAIVNRKCPVNGCGMDCPDKASAFPMQVVMVKRLRDLYMKRKSSSLSENAEDMKAPFAAQPCTADCDMNQQQHQQAAASCKEGESTGPMKHEAKWFCSICDENFCDEYYHNVHQRFKVTKGHPAVSLDDIDPVDRLEASLTKCSDPRHRGADVSMYDSSSGAFHCRLCDVSPQAENAKDTMQKDYAAMADMLQSSEGVYAKCTELHRNIGARIVYESSMLKGECDQVNAWYSSSIDRLIKERDKHLAELRSVSKQTQTRLKAERSKLTPLVQSVEATAVDIGVRPYRHTGEMNSRRTDYFDAPVVRKAKELLDTLNDLLTQLRVPAQDCYTSACAKGPVTRNITAGTVAADALFPLSEESPHFIASLNTAVDIALSIVQSSSLSTPSSASSTSHTSILSPVAAFHLLHRTAKDAKRPFIVPLVWFALGHCYHRGIGTFSSLQDAVNWYSKAAEAGMLWAMEMIAECHADDHWATSEKDKCKSVYADAIHRAVLYRSIAECKNSSEAPTAAALLVRTWALYSFTRDIGSLRADSPSMKEYKSTLPTLLRTHFLPRVMPVNNGITHQKDPLALFTLLNVDFRSVVPREEWYDILSQIGNTLSLAPAHCLIAKELVVGSRYYTQRDDDDDDVVSLSPSLTTATATASFAYTSSSLSISSSITTTYNGVSSQTHLTWPEKLWKSAEWLDNQTINRGINDTLADPLAALALAELSCDYLEGCFSLARLPSYSNAKKSKAYEWFQGFDADKSRLSQVRMLLSRWLHPVIVDGYESARVLSARLVLTPQHLVAKIVDNNGVSSRDSARVVVESTCPQGSSSAFALCRRLLLNAITKQKFASKPSSLVDCGVIPQQTTVSTNTFGTFSSPSSFGPPSTTKEAFLVAMLRPYAGRTATLRLTLPFRAPPNHLTALEVAAGKGNVDARVVIADCHSLLLYIRKHQALPQSTSAFPSFGRNHGSNNSGSLPAREGSTRQQAFAPWFGISSSASNGRLSQFDGVKLSTLKIKLRSPERVKENANRRESANEKSKMFEWHMKAANGGSASAMLIVGLCYEKGTGVEKNMSKAIEWYRKAADAGNMEAMLHVGVCYKNDDGVWQNESKAFEWYMKAANGGLLQAMFIVGVCYEMGTGVAKDSSKAYKWYKKAADGGDLRAIFTLAGCYNSGDGVVMDTSKAFEWYKDIAPAFVDSSATISAALGDLTAASGTEAGEKKSPDVPDMRSLGAGVAKDDSTTFEGYKRATNGGDVTAMGIVGLCYSNGTGIVKDESKALEWFRRAADNGDVTAMGIVAGCYGDGTGVVKDDCKAFEWYKKAADAGDVKAMFNVGVCYTNGTGVVKDDFKAYEWYKRAADGGDVRARYIRHLCYTNGVGVTKSRWMMYSNYGPDLHMGDVTAVFTVEVCYKNGDGGFKDMLKAIEWYKKSSNAGDVTAMITVGLSHDKETAVVKDVSKLVDWSKKAAEGGNVKALFNVAVCKGGVAKDELNAFEWYKKAADRGLVQAMYILGICYEYGIGVVKDMSKAVERYKQVAAASVSSSAAPANLTVVSGTCATEANEKKGLDSPAVIFGAKSAVARAAAPPFSSAYAIPTPTTTTTAAAATAVTAPAATPSGLPAAFSSASVFAKPASPLKSSFSDSDSAVMTAYTPVAPTEPLFSFKYFSQPVSVLVSPPAAATPQSSSTSASLQQHQTVTPITAATSPSANSSSSTEASDADVSTATCTATVSAPPNASAMRSPTVISSKEMITSKDESKVFERWEKAAEAGDANAMFNLAVCYKNGDGVVQDESKAIEWCMKAADGGVVQAMRIVGLCYKNGIGVAQEDSKAFDWFQKAADGGDARAMFNVGLCYMNGDGVVKDESKSFEWLSRAADAGDLYAMSNVGRCYKKGTGVSKDESKAFEWYKKAADGGDVQAMCNVGVCYDNGSGVARDESKAFEWYKTAADGGDVTAMFNLGACYADGVGVAKDILKAFEWYKRAADGGDVDAMYNVGLCYDNGTGVTKDDSKAFEWYQKGADGGDVKAMFNVAVRYREGAGVAKDESKAFEWFQKAADGGDARAMFNVGLCYMNGDGVVKDESKSFEWLSRAADAGLLQAMFNVGLRYEKGTGVGKDESKAFEWYMKAANGGLVQAMRNVAVYYDNGKGVAKDKAKAFEWYKKAADGGDVRAMFSVAASYKHGDGVAKDESKAFEWFKKAADAGLVHALFQVGLCYDLGIGVFKDEWKAFQWYKKAADGGDVTVMYNVAVCYANGEGVLQNESKAFEWYLKAGDGGMVQALYFAGRCYEDGIGVAKNEYMALEWYRKAACGGHEAAAAAMTRLRSSVYR